MIVNPRTEKMAIVAHTPIIKMRKELYMLMYEVAKHHRDEANEADRKNQTEEIKNSMICILFCYTCLEAFINTLGKDMLGDTWVTTNKKNSTEGKWKDVSRILSTKKYGRPFSVFNKRKEPFKSFLDLEIIREDSLVHRKAEFNEVVKTKYGNTEGTINTLNSEKANWACQTVKKMVTELAQNIEGAPSVAWVQ